MSGLIQASLVLMGWGMGVVFFSLAIFFVLILIFERVFKAEAVTREDGQ